MIELQEKAIITIIDLMNLQHFGLPNFPYKAWVGTGEVNHRE